MLPVGCLYIGTDVERNAHIRQRLSDYGVWTVCGEWQSDLLKDMQRGLYCVRKQAARVCIAAESEMCTAALALAVQFCVDRVALIHPFERMDIPDPYQRRQLNRLYGYAKRNLFFCVSDLLIVDSGGDATHGADALLGRMVNARIWRMKMMREDMVDPVARFMLCDDFGKTEYACES